MVEGEWSFEMSEETKPRFRVIDGGGRSTEEQRVFEKLDHISELLSTSIVRHKEGAESLALFLGNLSPEDYSYSPHTFTR
jgi:hypothetical protein